MPTRFADAVWNGTLVQGRGTVKLGSGAWEGNYSFGSRFEEAGGTNPEELLGGAHAACFSMALTNILAQAGFKAESIHTRAAVTISKVGEHHKITLIHLECEARIPAIDSATFQQKALEAKKGCPVSMALTGVEITMNANLIP
jgi:lipoyl-dependent peroxiredoxin